LRENKLQETIRALKYDISLLQEKNLQLKEQQEKSNAKVTNTILSFHSLVLRLYYFVRMSRVRPAESSNHIIVVLKVKAAMSTLSRNEQQVEELREQVRQYHEDANSVMIRDLMTKNAELAEQAIKLRGEVIRLQESSSNANQNLSANATPVKSPYSLFHSTSTTPLVVRENERDIHDSRHHSKSLNRSDEIETAFYMNVLRRDDRAVMNDNTNASSRASHIAIVSRTVDVDDSSADMTTSVDEATARNSTYSVMSTPQTDATAKSTTEEEIERSGAIIYAEFSPFTFQWNARLVLSLFIDSVNLLHIG
jgi:hypothetical protein